MEWVGDENVSLLVDLYELTMADVYHAQGMPGAATFELFVRRLPPERNFLVAAGLEDVLQFLEMFHFPERALDRLESMGLFRPSFLDWLSRLRFSGEVWAAPEGELLFAGEPLLRVTAPLIEAQLLESFLLNCVGFQTLVASKAARVRLAARDKRVVEFSMRRAHGADAALKLVRAAHIGGADATSNVLGALTYGIPPSGTLAHSFVLAFPDEKEAFEAFAQRFLRKAVLLIDTYSLEEGAQHAAQVSKALVSRRGAGIRAVRIDSGDLLQGAKRVRTLLDDAGCPEVEIVASGDLDELQIAALLEAGAPIDAFGVGTQLGTSADAPSLGAVYKLTEDAHGPKLKLSEGKATLPGKKQIHRWFKHGTMVRDMLALEGEHFPEAHALLSRVMARGRRLREAEPLAASRERCLGRLSELPVHLRALAPSPLPHPVGISEPLRRLTETLARAHPLGHPEGSPAWPAPLGG